MSAPAESRDGSVSMNMNMVTTVMAFSVSAFFVLFVFTRLLCARIHLRAAAGDPAFPAFHVERGIRGLEPAVVTSFPTVKFGDASHRPAAQESHTIWNHGWIMDEVKSPCATAASLGARCAWRSTRPRTWCACSLPAATPSTSPASTPGSSSTPPAPSAAPPCAPPPPPCLPSTAPPSGPRRPSRSPRPRQTAAHSKQKWRRPRTSWTCRLAGWRSFPTSRPPPAPVRAQLLLLCDYGCGGTARQSLQDNASEHC